MLSCYLTRYISGFCDISDICQLDQICNFYFFLMQNKYSLLYLLLYLQGCTNFSKMWSAQLYKFQTP